jgi:hypothetical protein
MKIRARGSAAAIAGALFALTAGITSVHAADWSDTFIGFRYSDNYKEPEPGHGPGGKFDEPAIGPVAKTIISLQHVSGYAYGTNFFNVDMLHSNGADSANDLSNDCNGGNCGRGGANEVYVVYRHTLSASKIFKLKLDMPVISDFGLTGGFDFNAKSGGIDPTVQKWLLGPSVSFKVPAGFWNASVMWYHEHNNNQFGAFGPQPSGSGCCGATSYTFDNTAQFATAWLIPLPGPEGALFKGFSTYTLSKGKDYNGNPTRPEWLNELQLMFDLGKWAGKKDTFYAGVGYQYWLNKFGTDHTQWSGSVANVWQIEFEAHF